MMLSARQEVALRILAQAFVQGGERADLDLTCSGLLDPAYKGTHKIVEVELAIHNAFIVAGMFFRIGAEYVEATGQ